MEPVIGIIESVEDALDYNQKDFKKVTLVGGQVLNVKFGQGGTLKAKWGILVAGVAIKFTMKPYTVPKTGAVVPVVQDIETVVEGLAPEVKVEASQAVTSATTTPAPPKPPQPSWPPPPAPAPAPQAVGKQGYKADPAKMSSIERQVAIKLACEISADTDSLEQIFDKADKIFKWISLS